MEKKIYVTLDEEDIQKLKLMASQEMRHYQSQAAFILKKELNQKRLTIPDQQKTKEETT